MAADVRDIWLRSSSCTPGKNCVEIGRSGTGVVIRDSKGGAELRTSDGVGWAAFLAHCRTLNDRLV
jgi:hypothetical protein